MNRPAYVESPCISVCQLDDATGLCLGCWRTRDEIAVWGRADTETRLAILEKLHERREHARGVRRRENRRRGKRT
mgnify:CR=1 FL=1